MTHNMTKKVESIIKFPVQIASQEEISACDDLSVVYWQGRLTIIRTLNRVVEGIIDWTPEMSEHLKTFNRISKEWGFMPLKEPMK